MAGWRESWGVRESQLQAQSLVHEGLFLDVVVSREYQNEAVMD